MIKNYDFRYESCTSLNPELEYRNEQYTANWHKLTNSQYIRLFNKIRTNKNYQLIRRYESSSDNFKYSVHLHEITVEFERIKDK